MACIYYVFKQCSSVMRSSLLAPCEEIAAGITKLWNYASIDSQRDMQQITRSVFKYSFPVSLIKFLNISQDKN